MQHSPAKWLEICEALLDERWRRIKVFDAYYEGDHLLNFMTKQWREAFGSQFAQSVDNWCPLVVDSSAERLKVLGFRFGDSQDADREAREVWDANNLSAASDLLHTEAIKLCEAYWLVEPRGQGEIPRVTCEHPSQFLVVCEPGNIRNRLAAFKKWQGEDGFLYANVYLPDAVYKWRSEKKSTANVRVDWRPRERVVNPMGVVPAVAAPNNPTMLGGGRSDLDGGVIRIQNAVNKLLADLLIGSEYIAYPQRVLLGVTPPVDPDTGQPMSPSKLQNKMGRLLVFSNEAAKTAEFKAGDLDNFAKSMDVLITHLMAQAKIPPHYVAGDINRVSGDTLKAAETGLVSKVRKKMEPFGDAHEEMMRLAFRAMGDRARAEESQVEVIWRNPESRSQAELADALSKLKTIGVPDEMLWEEFGFTPQQIDRMVEIRQADALLGLTEGEVAGPEAIGTAN